MGYKINKMSENKFLKLLIKSYGLIPFQIKKIDAKQSKSSKKVKGWRGKGIDSENEVVIDFNEKHGLKAAVLAIFSQAASAELKTVPVN